MTPFDLLTPSRKPRGISAVLIPFLPDGEIDWDAFRAHVVRTADAGLEPAVNMDTGYVNLLTAEQKQTALEHTRDALGGRPFVAGAFVADQPGAKFDADTYGREIEQIESFGGVPVIFQSYGLIEQPGPEIVTSYETISRSCDKFIGFELTQALALFGSIYDLDTYGGMMQIKKCIGAKHSSFDREPEWERLRLRNKLRPDFHVFTGNDFAIDMIQYGSDYLLGLSTFGPDLFARRDDLWANGNPAWLQLNDVLQYLGYFAFRSPGPAYKHTAAQFLKLRGWAQTSQTHPNSPTRPESDMEILKEIAERLSLK
ncbi:dihydrodipicolinate synthase family protein [Stratiformator vulcanicus]|nr:dihydrodipicolinate synthase family protein [Stratiformator vulcanicus]